MKHIQLFEDFLNEKQVTFSGQNKNAMKKLYDEFYKLKVLTKLDPHDVIEVMMNLDFNTPRFSGVNAEAMKELNDAWFEDLEKYLINLDEWDTPVVVKQIINDYRSIY